MKNSYSKNTVAILIVFACLGLLTGLGLNSPVAHAQGPVTPVPTPLPTNPHFASSTRLVDGKSIVEYIINGPPNPPPGTEQQRAPVALPRSNQSSAIHSLTVPAFNWVFGCSSVSAAMIAGYYDRNGFPNMYTGPTNGGLMPLDNSSWPRWTDSVGASYPSLPLAASRNGVDGRNTRGSIDDYWLAYGSSTQDPYLSNGWTQHIWSDAIGDYMKTSQSAYGNTDGSTEFYSWGQTTSQLTCAQMASYPDVAARDGTYGRKLFYQARGYTVTDCYNQNTDNNAGGFTYAMYKAEIDAGRPVMLNLAGHTIVGVGYDDGSNTIYIHDTWDYATHTMTWGGSYSNMSLLSVSIVNLQTATNPVPTIVSLNPSTAAAGGPLFNLTVNGTNFVNGSVVRWNGNDRSTTYVSGSQLTASISAADISSVGSASVTVFNPAPGGGTSNAAAFSISAPVCYALTTSASPNGDGSVNANPSPGCSGGTKYSSGTVVTVTATANTGYVFSSWSGSVSGSVNPTTVNLNADKNVTANFSVGTPDPRQAQPMSITGSLFNGGRVYFTINIENYGNAPTPALHPYVDGTVNGGAYWSADNSVPASAVIQPGQTVSFQDSSNLDETGTWTINGIYLWNNTAGTYWKPLPANGQTQPSSFTVSDSRYLFMPFTQR